ncbi:c-type cytochrome [Curvivirga sp.]|uniref:c-type cytochrome n=1 Tax=Curvivirga sp. TaxID=2856848 RepID=UPI003B5B9325
MKNLKGKIIPLSIIAIVLVGGGILGSKIISNLMPSSHEKLVDMPLSELAIAGKQAYDDTCMACHGKNAEGTMAGPTFIHKVYHPGHHNDGSFVRAVKMGVRQHHWPFGDMPAQPHVTDEEIRAIIQYVRELQKANNIY